MKAEKYLFTKWHFALVLLAGTAVRFIYGYCSQSWLAAPDQLAWQLGLDEMIHSKTLSYVQLVHAPHEGGSLLVSLVSLLFRPLSAVMPPLSWAALLIDVFSRAIQLKMAQKLLGNKTALFFGIWTVLSVPLLIPWGTVNYGLHSLFSFVPFVFLYCVIKNRQHRWLPAICGLLSGIAVSVSYDNLVLVMASAGFLVYVSQTFTNVLNKLVVFAAVFMLTVLPHILTRVYFDPAFGLGADSAFSIRDVPVGQAFSPASLINPVLVWFTSLPGSFLLSSPGSLPPVLLCAVVCVFMLTGVFVYARKSDVDKYIKLLSFCLVVLFVIVYAISPFYGKSFHETNYVYYRHWCYIIPLIVVIMIDGFLHSGKWKTYIITGWILLCGIASVQYILSVKKNEQPAYRATGWILAKKYMGDPGKLLQLHATAEQQYSNELLMGYGWGLSAAIFRNNSDDAAIEKLVSIIRKFPAADQPATINGVYYSFSKNITPVLDQGLPAKLRSRFPE